MVTKYIKKGLSIWLEIKEILENKLKMRTSNIQGNKKSLIQVLTFIFILNMLSLPSKSQVLFEMEEQEVEPQDYDNEREEPHFFNGIEEKRFRSSFDNIENSRGIDYSTQRNNRDHHEINVFGKEEDLKMYQFNQEEIQGNNSQSNRVIISSEGNNNWQFNQQNNNSNSNVNSPTGTNPFGTNPGVKTPRNMDAVPDNGDDPNDVPLDGGISILGLAAVAYGYKKYRK